MHGIEADVWDFKMACGAGCKETPYSRHQTNPPPLLPAQVHLVDNEEVHWFSRQGHEHGAKSSYDVLDGVVRRQAAVGNLVLDGERCVGVTAWDLVHGGVQGVEGRAVILATGGLGRIYRGTTNAYACTGDGMSMAWRAGVPLS